MDKNQQCLVASKKKQVNTTQFIDESKIERTYREPRVFALSEDEEKEHLEFMEKNLNNAVWLLSNEDKE